MSEQEKTRPSSNQGGQENPVQEGSAVGVEYSNYYCTGPDRPGVRVTPGGEPHALTGSAHRVFDFAANYLLGGADISDAPHWEFDLGYLEAVDGILMTGPESFPDSDDDRSGPGVYSTWTPEHGVRIVTDHDTKSMSVKTARATYEALGKVLAELDAQGVGDRA